jgi:hypothetical protein
MMARVFSTRVAKAFFFFFYRRDEVRVFGRRDKVKVFFFCMVARVSYTLPP